MARSWFTTRPDNYFLRLTRKGHRNEVAFTLIALGFVHYYCVNPLIDSFQRRSIQQDSDWKRTNINGSPLTVHPQEKIQLKFFA